MNQTWSAPGPAGLIGAIVGLGRMGLTHLAILNNHPAVGKLHVVESSACFGKAIEKHLGHRYYPSLDELFRFSVPDFIVVATPTDSHFKVVKVILERGIHTFIEKPLSMSVPESQFLAQLAKDRGVVAQVGYVNRFNEIFQAVRSLLQSGELGHPTHIQCEIRSPMVIKSSGTSWRSKQGEGGGCLADIAAHGIDLMNFLVGPPRAVLGASLQSLVSQCVEDRVDGLFVYDGFTGALHVNWSDPSCRKPAYRINVQTERGRIIADHHAYKVFRTLPGNHGNAGSWSTVYITDIAQPVRMYVRGNEFTRQIDYFIDSILIGRRDNLSGVESALEVDKIIAQIRVEDEKRVQ